MEISIAGIEEAVGGLGYRESSHKARLIRTIQRFYEERDSPDNVRAIEGDELIDRMWNLGGDRKAIRSRRKNLSSIKSSINQDLDNAWETGRNPEGITIGPLNTFVMSDAAKDRILNSFSGSMNLEGGNSLDRVAEALKIVSDFISKTSSDVDGEQLSNLKALIEGLSDKFREGDGESKIVEEKVDNREAETENGGPEEVTGDGAGNGEDGTSDDDGDALEIVDADEIDLEDSDELIELEEEDTGDGEDIAGEETGMDEAGKNAVELLGGEDLEDADEIEIVYEDETDDTEEEAGDVEDDVMEEVIMDDETGGNELDGSGLMTEDLEEGSGEDQYETVEEIEDDELAADEADEIELTDEDEILEGDDDLVTVEETDDVEPDGADKGEDEDIVELLGAESLEDADEVELVDADEMIVSEEDDVDDAGEDTEFEDVAEETLDEFEDDVEEIDDWKEGEADDAIPGEEIPGEDVGLPIDQLMEEAKNFEEFQLDEKQKRLLAEQFDGYLGAMERYYNQYIFIKKGSYQVGADRVEEDVLPERQILMADYYMGKYPVTNALFEVFVERTGYKTTAEKLGYGYVYHGRFRKVVDQNTGLTSSIWNSTYTREKVMGATWYQPIGPGSTLHKKRNHPVVQVSIRDARTFAAWTGKRLPSEIEWEAAARTRDGFRFPWGDEWIEGFCNFESSGISDTCPVDHFPHSANETGLADLLGNVMEWTSDECDAKYPLETPGRFFIAKGGSWISPEQTTLFDRCRFEADFTSNILGFRCLAD